MIDKTYMTFYDFDTGMPQFDDSNVQVEVMQMGPEASTLELASPTEIVQYPTWSDFLSADALASFQSRHATISEWTTPINTATTYGVGNDNPATSYTLTTQQRGRSVLVGFENISFFTVRYAISACCTTGRNFLFAGCESSQGQLNPQRPYTRSTRKAAATGAGGVRQLWHPVAGWSTHTPRAARRMSEEDGGCQLQYSFC